MAYDLNQLATELGVSTDRAQEILSSNSLSLSDVDGEVVAVLKADLEGPIAVPAVGVRRPKTRSNGSLPAKVSPDAATQGSSSNTADEIRTAIDSPDLAIAATFSLANQKAAERLRLQQEAEADLIADAIVSRSTTMLRQVTDHFLASFTAAPLLEAMTEAAVDRGYVPQIEATIDIKSAAVD